MKQIMLALSIILLLSGCSSFSEPKISEENAREIVMKEHSKSIGQVEIISVQHEGNAYVVTWQNKINCENGVDYVSDQNGEIIKGETTIC